MLSSFVATLLKRYWYLGVEINVIRHVEKGWISDFPE